jgi:hypothetical protein
MKITMLAFGLLFAAVPAFAADIDGIWTGSIDTPGGAMAIKYTFKADGEKLTGSTSAADGPEVPLQDGKVTGNKISFSFTVDFGGGPVKFDYTGEVSGSDLKLHSTFMDMPIDVTLKKA